MEPLDPKQGVENIRVDDISPSPYQPRVHFDEAELDDLGASIKEKGVLQPVLIRVVEGKEKPYELVVGERRLRASKKIGNETIPCLIRILTDDEAHEITLIENLQRADLTPMEEARSVQGLVETHGGNKAAAARAVGKQDAYVYNLLELLTLPREVQNMIEARIINVAQARVILEIEGEDKQIQGAQLAQKLNLSAAQLRGRMQKYINKPEKSRKESTGERKPTSFKKLSSSLVEVYESLEGFDFNDLEGDEKGLKDRDMLRRQTALVRQSLARAETALLRDPPAPKPVDGSKPPRLGTTAA